MDYYVPIPASQIWLQAVRHFKGPFPHSLALRSVTPVAGIQKHMTLKGYQCHVNDTMINYLSSPLISNHATDTAGTEVKVITNN